MECSFQEIIRETKNAINARLDMLESLINSKKTFTVDIGNESMFHTSLNERMSNLENIVSSLKNFDTQNPELVIIEKESLEPFEETPVSIVYNKDYGDADDEAEAEEEPEAHELEVHEPEAEAHESEPEPEAEPEPEPEEEEAEGKELTEFTYRGMTLYHDDEYKVYQLGGDGEISDPIGIWDAAKGKIKKIT